MAFNAINWSFGSRWNGNEGGPVFADSASGGYYGVIQQAVLTMQMSSFICP